MAKRKQTSGGPSIRTRQPRTMPSPVELSQRFMRLQTGDLCNTLDVMGEQTQMLDLRIKPLRRGMKCAGIAVTWNAVLACHDPLPRDSKAVKSWRHVTDFVAPGTVFVYQPGGEMSSGHLGSMYGTMISTRGAAGAVVDGNLRDSDGHEQLPDWSVFSRGTSPLEAASRIKWLEPNTPILMSGELQRWIKVVPGDMILADGDGVMVVPQKLIMPVLKKAEKVADAEEKAQKAYAAGGDPEEVAKKYGAA